MTQDRDQEQSTITTERPIPLAVYDDRYTWAKYGSLILPQMMKLNERQNSQLLSKYCSFLCEFLRIDLEGNISKTLDFSTNSKLSDYLSSLFEGLSETATREKTFDGYMKTAEEKGVIIKKSFRNCSICNNHSSFHIDQFISPEVLEAYIFGINTGNIAAVLYRDEF